jgi:hypothetical protein
MKVDGLCKHIKTRIKKEILFRLCHVVIEKGGIYPSLKFGSGVDVNPLQSMIPNYKTIQELLDQK